MNNYKKIVAFLFVVGFLSVTPFFVAEASINVSTCGVLNQANETYTLM